MLKIMKTLRRACQNNCLDIVRNVITQQARTIRERPLKVLTSRTYRNLQILNLWLPLVFHIYSCLLQEKQTFRCSKWGRPQDVYGLQMGNVLETKEYYILGTSVGRRSNMFFNNSQTR